MMDKYNLPPEAIAFVGDDLNDLAVLSRVGLACAVANAVPEVKAIAHYVASHEGGRGAVREIIEYILKAQDKWNWVVEQYTTAGPVETQQ